MLQYTHSTHFTPHHALYSLYYHQRPVHRYENSIRICALDTAPAYPCLPTHQLNGEHRPPMLCPQIRLRRVLRRGQQFFHPWVHVSHLTHTLHTHTTPRPLSLFIPMTIRHSQPEAPPFQVLYSGASFIVEPWLRCEFHRGALAPVRVSSWSLGSGASFIVLISSLNVARRKKCKVCSVCHCWSNEPTR